MTRTPVAEYTLYALVCLYLAALYVVPSDIWLGFTINALIISVLAIGWNVLGGFAGQMSFGHAALFGTGAYAQALLQIHFGVNPWLAAVLAVAIAALVGAVIASLAFRYGLRGSYFALVTLAFAEVFRIVASSFGFFGGAQGNLVPYKAGLANFQFTDRITTYTFAIALVAVAMLLAAAIKRSRFGAYLIAIRENEEAAKALGIDVFRCKVLAMTLSGAISGAAGVFYLQTYLFVDPQVGFGSAMSIEALLGPIIGGIGTIWGPLVGSLLLHLLGEGAKHLVQNAPGLNLVLYAVVLLVILRYVPEGVVGLIRRLRRSAPAADAGAAQLSTKEAR